MDKLFAQQRRSANMAAIRGKDTKPEMIVRRGLWKRGFRYRLYHKRLPGHPDLVLKKYRTCIFVNGCFWHGHRSLTSNPSPEGKGGSSLQWQIMVDGSDPNMAQQWTTYAQSILSQPVDGKHYSLPSPFGEGLGVRLLYNPQMKSAYNFVPAIMGMLLMLICAMMTSISIVREKEKGTMEVLLVSPVRPLMVIIAKAVPYLVLAFAILITILLMARFVLGVPLAGSLFWILAVSTLYILLALSLGLLISNVAQTQLVALLLSAMVLLMPVVMLPQVLQWLAAVVPPRYYIEAMRKLMIMGVGFGEVAREVAVLAIMTVVLLAIALKKFNVRLE